MVNVTVLRFLIALSAVTFIPISVHADNGVAPDKIVFGRSLPLSGSQSAIGKNLELGADIYFKKLNAAGGIHGRKLEIITYDDGFDPRKTSENVEKLVSTDKVFALFDLYGGANAVAALPVVRGKSVPFVAPFTGLKQLRDPVVPEIFNVRASFSDEAEGLVAQAFDKMGIKEIGVFIQHDAYGENGRGAVSRALGSRGAKLQGEGKYARETLHVDEAVSAIIAARPKAVVCFSLSDATRAFIDKLHAKNFHPLFLLSNTVATPAVLTALGTDEAYVSFVAPLPAEKAKYPIIGEFAADAAAAGHADALSQHFALQGYIDAKVLAKALEKSGKDLTRASLAEGFTQLNGADIGGIRLNYSATNHNGIEQVFVRKIVDGKIQPAG